LFSAGELAFKFFVLKRGEVEIVDQTLGRDQIVTIYSDREVTGDVAMPTGRPSLVSAIARTACDAYEVSAARLRRILNEMPRPSDVLLRAFFMH
jgi:thioredoxin reductase (NADPH)